MFLEGITQVTLYICATPAVLQKRKNVLAWSSNLEMAKELKVNVIQGKDVVFTVNACFYREKLLKRQEIKLKSR